VARFVPASKPDLAYDFARRIQTRLASLGFFETRNLKLISGAQLEDDRATTHRGMNAIRLKNPLNDEQDYLRPGLIPGMLATARRNVHQGNSDLRLFEMGRVFTAAPNGKEIEHEHLALLMSGLRAERSWHDGKPGDLDLFDLRSVLENLCSGVPVRFAAAEDERLLCPASIEIGSGKKPVKLGLAGIIPPVRARQLDIEAPIAVAELNMKKLAAALGEPVQFDELPRYPAVTRDIAIEAPASLENGAIESFFAGRNEPLLESFEMIDLFSDPTGEKLAADKRSITWSLTYRDANRTLESAEVDRAHSEILDSLKSKFPIEFR
jgi:phenylalanyl-tRNA synthetase beta chain